MKNSRATALAITLSGLALCLAVPAFAADAGGSAETRFQIGLTAMSGMTDLTDKLEANNPYLDAKRATPLGVSFAVYHDFGAGLAVGATVGPVTLGTGDVSFAIVPLALDVRYRFLRNDTMSSYVRAGVEKAFASGDLVENAGTGGVLALGFEFAAPCGRGWGLELAYRSTQVGVKPTIYHAGQNAKPCEGTLSGFYTF